MQVANDVLAVLSTVEIDGPFVKIGNKLDRTLYTAVNKVLEACGGKWERRHQAHLFDGDARERIEHVIVLGEVTTDKDLGFFRTPRPIARELVRIADVQPGHFVLEPSAGDGMLADSILEAGAGVWCVERDNNRRQRLVATYSQHVLDRRVVVVSPPTPGYNDFMEYNPTEPFDRVVMNPPFCKVGIGDHLDHVQHALGMLAPDGVLVSVLPMGVMFRNDRRHREFREGMLKLGGGFAAKDRDVDGVPAWSFAESGTNVRVCWLRVRRSP